MNTTELKHIEDNLTSINVWIENNSKLQPSADVLQPIIKAYERDTEFIIHACQSCLIDMLVWARMEYKKTLKTKTDDKLQRKENK